MTHRLRGLGLAATLVLALTLGVSLPAGAQSTAAYVYVQVGGPAGAVYGYGASPAGQLTAIPGSPFKPGTAIVGGNGAYIFTLGKQNLHSFGVSSNGAIGAQAGQVPVLDYAGGSCGGGSQQGIAAGAVLDHTGKSIYVMLDPVNCVAWQSYAITSAGVFNFTGETEEPQSLFGSDLESVNFGLPSILGNETYAYAEYPNENTGNQELIGFRRDNTGTLQLMQFNETDPASSGTANPHDPDASPAGNYVVVQLNPGGALPTYLASYAVDSQGDLSTTNTTSNMPTTTLVNPSTNLSAYPTNSAFSLSGNLIAFYGGAEAQGSDMNGIEIYNFNGAAPLTLNSKLLTGTSIDQIAWDSSNHLYAISKSQNKLWVFTVTSTSVTQDASYSLGSPVSMVVVSQTPSTGGGCTAPSGDGVNVCAPAEGSTANSPVQISAAATVSGGVYRFELWSGSTKLASVDSGVMNQAVSLAPGTYKLTFDAYNVGKTEHEYATRDITVK